jgi:hypothetical protein
MIHPDQIYTVRQLQHHDLQAEAERERMKREFVGDQTAWGRVWPATWLRRLSTRRTHAGRLTNRAV